MAIRPMTAQEIEALLEEHFEDDEEFCDVWETWAEKAGGYSGSKTVEVPGLGTVTVSEYDFGGVETNLAHLIFEIEGRTFRKEGLWVSFSGMYWDGNFHEVKPVQKVITDYEVI